MRRTGKFFVALVSLWVTLSATAVAATLDSIGTFDRPIYVTSDPDDPDRLFVVEREGRVMVSSEGGFSLFGDLEALVSCCTGERGLASIALAPDFASTQRFYAAYAGTAAAGGTEGDLHLDAFRPAPEGGGALIREPILTIPHSEAANHNGGQLQFGPDGYLYLSTGDGGTGGNPAQDLDSLLGKVLRLEPRPGQEPSYVAPAGNPFVGVAGRDEIWAYGFRNPWRFSFDRESGDLLVADVGQAAREELDLGAPGANYGWNCREGLIAYTLAPESCDGVVGFTDPVFEYPHDDPEDGSAYGCSIVGGYVVRDPGMGALIGRYLYADFCVGELRSLLLPAGGEGTASGDRSEGLNVPFPVSFGEDSCGRIYVASNKGGVFRLEGDAPTECPQPAGPKSEVTVRVIVEPAAVWVGLRARRAKHGRAARLTARVAPCQGHEGDPIQLNRGGKRLQRKRMDESCRARFHVRGDGTSTFRSIFEGQRSQVRTIAFAKPRP